MSATKAIFHTLSSRFVGAALNLLLLWFTSRWMGAGVRGEISLYFSSIYLLVLVSGFAGGSTLIYLAPRFALNRLLVLAYGWCLGVSLLLVPALAWWPGLPAPQLGWWMVSSLLFNLTAANRYLLLGQGRIQTDNLLGIGVNAIQFLLLLVLVLGTASRSLQAFVWAFVGAWAATWLISLIVLMRTERQLSTETAWKPLLKAAFGLGFLAQMTNLAQFVAYRIQFYLIDVAAGKEAVGVFSTTVSLAEAVWMITQSISLVQLSRIVQSDDKAAAAQWSLPWFKISVLLSALVLGFLLLLPAEAYVWIFGKDFGQIPSVLFALAPGVLALAGSNILAHYFAGTAQLRFNLGASLLSLAVVTNCSHLLLTHGGIVGAAWASSVAYILGALWLMWQFKKQHPVSLRQWFPGKQDVQLIRKFIAQYVRY